MFPFKHVNDITNPTQIMNATNSRCVNDKQKIQQQQQPKSIIPTNKLAKVIIILCFYF